MTIQEPFAVSVGSGPYRYSFSLSGNTLRLTIPDVAVVTMSRDEWLTVVAAFSAVYQDDIGRAKQ